VRGEAAAAPWPLVQPAARLKTYSRLAHVHRADVHTMYVHLDVASHADHRQSTRRNTGSTRSHIIFLSLFEQDGGPLVRIYVDVQGGSLQQPDSDSKSVQ